MTQITTSLHELLQVLVEGTLTDAQLQQLVDWELEDERRADAFGITIENVTEVVRERSHLFQAIYPVLWESEKNADRKSSSLDFWQKSKSYPLVEGGSNKSGSLPFIRAGLGRGITNGAKDLLFLETLWNLWLPLGCQIASNRQVLERPLIQGILGLQGTGKTTLAAILSLILTHLGYRTISLSLDDLYKTYSERLVLKEQDPRLVWRGPPGTHDIGLGIAILDRLRRKDPNEPIPVPRFDKSLRDGAGDRTQPTLVKDVDIVLFEGWFVGVRPIDPAAFDTAPPPIITEADRQFARDMNTQLKNYLPLWKRLDHLMLLYPVDYRLSKQWRGEAESQMIAEGLSGMTNLMVEQFVEYFWRSLHPELFIKPLMQYSKVDLVIEIHCDRSISAIYRPHS